MRALALALALLPLCATATLAGPMPILPDLPPLPTNYTAAAEGGFYAGLLAGPALGSGIEDGFEASIVVGNTMSAADLLLGLEAMASADFHGGGALEASLRLGFPLADSVTIYGAAGLGYDFDNDAFAVLAASAEAEIGNGWLVRADYRLNLDLSGEPATHRILSGLVKRF